MSSRLAREHASCNDMGMWYVFWLALSLGLPAMAENAPLCRDVFQDVEVGTSNRLTGLLRRADDLRRVRGELREAQLPTSRIDNRLSSVKKQMGLRLIVSSLKTAAEKLDEVIITRDYNEAALANLSRSTAPKPMDLHVKTARTGPLAGFVPRDPLVSEPGISSEKLATLNAEVADLLARGLLKALPLDEVADHFSGDSTAAEILADANGHPITSDVDLWGILRRENTGPVRYVDKLGWVTATDHRSIDAINSSFHRIDPRELRRDLVQHGPWVAHPEARESDYPLWTFEPNGRVQRLENAADLEGFIAEMRQLGYEI